MGNCGECCCHEEAKPQQELIFPTRTQPTPPPPPRVQTLDEFRNNVRRISPLDYVIPADGRNAEIDGLFYNVIELTKEYEPATFNEQQAYDELVWKQPYIQTRFYNVEFQRGKDKVQAVSKLFAPLHRYQ